MAATITATRWRVFKRCVIDRMPRIDQRQFFFVHVMKTAGTTFAHLLQHEFPRKAVYPCEGVDWTPPTDYGAYTSIPRLLSVSAERRATVSVYTGHFPFMVCDLLGVNVVLTLLREPVERTISALKHFRREEPYRHLALEEIYDDVQIFRFFIENYQTKVFALEPEDGQPALNCGLTMDDRRFSSALDNLGRVDVVGLTEAYDDFVDEIRHRFGWFASAPHQRVNVSRDNSPVNPALRRRIAADNAYDIALYERARVLAKRRE